MGLVADQTSLSEFLNVDDRGFPGGPVAGTWCSQCRWPGSNPWSGNWMQYATAKTQCSQINTYFKKSG